MVEPTVVLNRATDRLQALAGDGVWHGFPTLAGQSEVWVSGFVLAHLGDTSITGRDRIVASLLDARNADGGWSYGEGVPTDADSTAWCTIAVGSGSSVEELDDARRVLREHRLGDGFATYGVSSGIEAFMGKPPGSASGWMSPNADVTAAVVLAGVPDLGTDDFEDVVRWLAGRRNGAGFVESYWWRGPYYATALTLRALNHHGRCLDAESEGIMFRGLSRMQLPDGGFGLGSDQRPDAFSTALALEALCRLGHLDETGRRDRAARWLVMSQEPDGGWPGAYVMRIPAPDVLQPRSVAVWHRGTGGGNSYVPDVNGVFATAMSIHALSLWLEHEAEPAALEPVAPVTRERDVTVVAANPR